MHEEGFTGLDVDRAIKELDNFHDCCKETEVTFINTFTDLFQILYLKWASPNAVWFTNEQIPIISEEITNFINTYNRILSGANLAAATLASAHGSAMPIIYSPSTVQFALDVNKCEENKNGVTGMAKEDVKNALDTFVTEKNRALEMLRRIPLGISFYDPAGHLLSTYNKGVNEFIERFDQIIITLTSTLATYMETEINNILLAKQKAEETLAA